MDIWIYGYMDIWTWVNGYMDIWTYGWIYSMIGSHWGGEGCCPLPPRPPLIRIFMRGSAPQTPHRFNGYTRPHLDSNVPMDICMDISMHIHGYVRVLAQGVDLWTSSGCLLRRVDLDFPVGVNLGGYYYDVQSTQANVKSFRPMGTQVGTIEILTCTRGLLCIANRS